MAEARAPVPRGDVDELLRGLSCIELAYARRDCWSISESPTLEDHIAAGRRIGAAGRRVGILTLELSKAGQRSGPGGVEPFSTLPSLVDAYAACADFFAELGIEALAPQLALKQCIALLDHGPVEPRPDDAMLQLI